MTETEAEYTVPGAEEKVVVPALTKIEYYAAMAMIGLSVTDYRSIESVAVLAVETALTLDKRLQELRDKT